MESIGAGPGPVNRVGRLILGELFTDSAPSPHENPVPQGATGRARG
jgi:hypothetical protein